jgi:uncharacterized protein
MKKTECLEESGPLLRGLDTISALKKILASFPSAAVAFSGGVDSTLLLRMAGDVMGADRVLALTVESVFSPAWELDESRRLADSLGVRHIVLSCDILKIPEVAVNNARRCYHCKRAIMTRCLKKARELGYSVLMDGSNRDDLRDYRPGNEAVRQLGVRSPLLEAGLTKEDIRRLSRKLLLPTADRAAFSCLATRIPYGQPLTPKNLRQVEDCENFLYQKGFHNFRARHHGDTVRIEVTERDLPRLLEKNLRETVTEVCRRAGFQYVTLDLEGYRTGRMNEILS